MSGGQNSIPDSGMKKAIDNFSATQAPAPGPTPTPQNSAPALDAESLKQRQARGAAATIFRGSGAGNFWGDSGSIQKMLLGS